MIIVVDGYNLFKAVVQSSTVSMQQKRVLTQKLAKYSKKTGHTIVLFFDGGHWGCAGKEVESGLDVFYSGSQQSADTLINRYVQNNKNSEILLVTSDREIRNHAKMYDVVSLASLQFYSIIQHKEGSAVRSPSSFSSVKKFDNGELNAELDQLMRAVSVGTIKDDSQGYLSGERHVSVRTLSKRERKLKKLTDKL